MCNQQKIIISFDRGAFAYDSIRYRTEKKISRKKLADITGVSERSIRAYEDQKAMPSIVTVAVLCLLIDKNFLEYMKPDEI